LNLRGEDGRVKKKYIIAGVLSVFFLIIAGIGIYGVVFFSSIERTSLPADIGKVESIIDIELMHKDIFVELALIKKANEVVVPIPINVLRGNEVVNIALFGLDSRKPGTWSRSDTIMVVSIDKVNNKIKVTSIMRDIFLPIPGRGSDKINAAYAYGGPELAINTLNTNFGLNISDFVTVNFFGLEKLINKVGGLDINVKSYEIENINQFIDEVSQLSGEEVGKFHIVKPGLQSLNGRQAVSYGRIRYVGNGDYERTERQRKIIEVLYDKIRSRGIAKLPGTVNSILPYVKTSLTNGEIIELASLVMGFEVKDLESSRVPFDGLFETGRQNGAYAMQLNMEGTLEKLYEFIYGAQLGEEE
jgi:polyisoprenyl-teichoic acid--peptidoglycan teichoic acid transferase